jgi:hypothetical protein
MGWMVQGLNPGWCKRFFSSSERQDWLLDLPSLLFNGKQHPLLVVKWLRCDADHSPPSSAKVKNKWSYTSSPSICLHGMARDYN